MSVVYERGQNGTSQFNSHLTPPAGWSAATAPISTQPKDEKSVEAALFVDRHLPMATKRAERLIAAIENKFGMEVPESYLRLRADGTFQVLLLVKQEDYSSPKMAGAKLLAEEYTRTDVYDICFTFSVLSETNVNSVVLPYGYKLKHIQQHLDGNQGFRPAA